MDEPDCKKNTAIKSFVVLNHRERVFMYNLKIKCPQHERYGPLYHSKFEIDEMSIFFRKRNKQRKSDFFLHDQLLINLKHN